MGLGRWVAPPFAHRYFSIAKSSSGHPPKHPSRLRLLAFSSASSSLLLLLPFHLQSSLSLAVSYVEKGPPLFPLWPALHKRPPVLQSSVDHASSDPLLVLTILALTPFLSAPDRPPWLTCLLTRSSPSTLILEECVIPIPPESRGPSPSTKAPPAPRPAGMPTSP